MSLKKIAEIKRRFYDGGDYGGPAGDMGASNFGYDGTDVGTNYGGPGGDMGASSSGYSGTGGWGGGLNFGANAPGANADPEGTADANRANGTPGAESQGGFGGPGAGGGPSMSSEDIANYVNSFKQDTDEQKVSDTQRAISPGALQAASGILGLLGVPASVSKFGLGKLNDYLGRPTQGYSVDDAAGIGQRNGNTAEVDHNPPEPSTQPFGNATPMQTTPAAGAAAAASTGMRQYVWDPATRQYRLTNLGAGENPMGYTKGQTFQMAAGGPAPRGISAGAPRFVQGGGTGLSDSIPVSMDDGGEGRLADGEFVVPADVVSGLGGGSSEAGSRILYDMMERIRQQAHGSTKQIRPVNPQQTLPA